MEKERKSVEKKDAMNRARWRVGVREIAAGVNPATPFTGINPDQNWIDDHETTTLGLQCPKIDSKKKIILLGALTHTSMD